MKITHKNNDPPMDFLKFIGNMVIMFVLILTSLTLYFLTNLVVSSKAEASSVELHFPKPIPELTFDLNLDFSGWFTDKPYGLGTSYPSVYEWIASYENKPLYFKQGNPLTCAYRDYKRSNGTWAYSIGYGSVAKSPSECITKEQAWKRFLHIAKDVRFKISQEFPWMKPNQVDAFTSFTFNVKTKHSNHVKNLFHQQRDTEAMHYWESICMKGTRFAAGLCPRRSDEVDVYYSHTTVRF